MKKSVSSNRLLLSLDSIKKVSMYTKKQRIEINVIFLFIVFAVELFTILISKKGVYKIYNAQEHLPWALPLYWLVPIWTVLYALVAFSGALIWTKRPSHIRSFAMRAWILQIALNVLWPICFFYTHIAILTPILITILFMALLILMFYSFLISRLATLLLVPYFLMALYKLLFHWILYILNLKTF